MSTQTIETDYLVVGAGAAGMAFTDALLAASAAQVVMIDRQHAPGGHWLDAYPFVRLHQPSAFYGVNSLPLGSETIDQYGSNRGWYERATGAEICAYYKRVMDQTLLPTGRLRYFPLSDYAGSNRFVSRASGVQYEVKVRKKIVDARYLQTAVPANTEPPFEVAEGARCVPVNALARIAGRTDGYVIIGAGKTAADACLWLLEIGVPASEIRWIKSREAWFMNRAYLQGGELVGSILEGLSLQLEAAALSSTLDELFKRLSDSQQLLRVDESVTPAAYRASTMSAAEIEQLRRIEHVVRLGRVKRIEREAIVLDQGTIPTSERQVHVHCAANGLNPAPAVPMFTADKITLQPMRTGLIPFNAALVGFVAATRDDIAEQNRLCPINLLPKVPMDWVRGMLVSMDADYQWLKQPDIAAWLERSRLNPSRGLARHAAAPELQATWARYREHLRPGLARLREFAAEYAV